MTYEERYATILEHTILEAITKPDYHGYRTLEIVHEALMDRVLYSGAGYQETREADLVRAFVRYLESLIREGKAKAAAIEASYGA